MKIREITDPLKRFFAYVEERDAIYWRRRSGQKWPWTDDDILQTYRFTEIYRERDKVSLHYQRTVRDRYKDQTVIPATVLYRWFNRISTCDALFNEPDFGNQSYFERYIETGDVKVLLNLIKSLPVPHITGAFIITGKPGMPKSEGVATYFHEWQQSHDWGVQWVLWEKDEPNPTLRMIFTWLGGEGLGNFMTAQLVADLKYLPIFKNAHDWWSWAAPGPGSMRGLNVVLKRDMNDHWNRDDWLEHLQWLNEKENEHFFGHSTIGRFHAQDTQNHLCEWSKYTKVLCGTGRPRQIFKRPQ